MGRIGRLSELIIEIIEIKCGHMQFAIGPVLFKGLSDGFEKWNTLLKKMVRLLQLTAAKRNRSLPPNCPGNLILADMVSNSWQGVGNL